MEALLVQSSRSNYEDSEKKSLLLYYHHFFPFSSIWILYGILCGSASGTAVASLEIPHIHRGRSSRKMLSVITTATGNTNTKTESYSRIFDWLWSHVNTIICPKSQCREFSFHIAKDNYTCRDHVKRTTLLTSRNESKKLPVIPSTNHATTLMNTNTKLKPSNSTQNDTTAPSSLLPSTHHKPIPTVHWFECDHYVKRYQCFLNAKSLQEYMIAKLPLRIDIGAVYSIKPSKPSQELFDRFSASSICSNQDFIEERELVFDIDIEDYDRITRKRYRQHTQSLSSPINHTQSSMMVMSSMPTSHNHPVGFVKLTSREKNTLHQGFMVLSKIIPREYRPWLCYDPLQFDVEPSESLLDPCANRFISIRNCSCIHESQLKSFLHSSSTTTPSTTTNGVFISSNSDSTKRNSIGDPKSQRNNNRRRLCKRCWPLLLLTTRILYVIMKKHYGFSNTLSVFSGRRGIHFWVFDSKAKVLLEEQRKQILSFVHNGVYSRKERNKKTSHPPRFHHTKNASSSSSSSFRVYSSELDEYIFSTLFIPFFVRHGNHFNILSIIRDVDYNLWVTLVREQWNRYNSGKRAVSKRGRRVPSLPVFQVFLFYPDFIQESPSTANESGDNSYPHTGTCHSQEQQDKTFSSYYDDSMEEFVRNASLIHEIHSKKTSSSSSSSSVRIEYQKVFLSRQVLKEICFGYFMPRVDEKVTTSMNHLLKLPFSIHPDTRNICIPLFLHHPHQYHFVRDNGIDIECNDKSTVIKGHHQEVENPKSFVFRWTEDFEDFPSLYNIHQFRHWNTIRDSFDCFVASFATQCNDMLLSHISIPHEKHN